MAHAICATCGEQKQLFNSPTIDGIKQPRRCKDCVLLDCQGAGLEVNDEWWVLQLWQTGETETIDALIKQATHMEQDK